MSMEELERRQTHMPTRHAKREEAQEPKIEAKPCHGVDHSIRPSVDNLEFRFLRGEWPAEEYSYLQSMGWDQESGQINIKYTSGRTYLISGRNLRPVYEKLRRHRIDYFREQGKGSADDMEASSEDPIIYRIEVFEASIKIQLKSPE